MTDRLAIATPWHRSAAFYWAFLWRSVLVWLGSAVAFYLIAGPVEAAVAAPPLIATLFDLAVLSVLMPAAGCLAVRECSRASFGDYRLRVEPKGTIGLTLGEAAQIAWAQLWRSAVVAIPVYFLARWLLVPLALVLLSPATARAQLLDRQLVYVTLLLLIGLWAMREALSIRYASFHLRWASEALESACGVGALITDP
jgi:hypothetical protein